MNIAIVGIGLIGGSIAIRLKETSFADKIIGVDKSEANQKKAIQLGLVDEIQDLDEAIESSKIIILTTTVDAIMQLAPYILDKVTDQVLIDMESTKINILQKIADHPNRGRDLAAHPMADTEYSGPEAAIPNLFKDKNMVYVEAFKSDEDAFDLADTITEQLEMKSLFMNAEEHDMHTAY